MVLVSLQVTPLRGACPFQQGSCAATSACVCCSIVPSLAATAAWHCCLACRLAYELPGGPSPVALNAVRGLLQCALLLAANLMWPTQQQPQTDVGAAAEEIDTEAPRGAGVRHHKQQQQQQPEAGPPGRWRELLASRPPAVLGGIEIGLYNTLGTTLQAVGLAVSGPMPSKLLGCIEWQLGLKVLHTRVTSSARG